MYAPLGFSSSLRCFFSSWLTWSFWSFWRRRFKIWNQKIVRMFSSRSKLSSRLYSYKVGMVAIIYALFGRSCHCGWLCHLLFPLYFGGCPIHSLYHHQSHLWVPSAKTPTIDKAPKNRYMIKMNHSYAGDKFDVATVRDGGFVKDWIRLRSKVMPRFWLPILIFKILNIFVGGLS